MDTLSSTKEARIYNGVKTISLTSGAGKTGQPGKHFKSNENNTDVGLLSAMLVNNDSSP